LVSCREFSRILTIEDPLDLSDIPYDTMTKDEAKEHKKLTKAERNRNQKIALGLR